MKTFICILVLVSTFSSAWTQLSSTKKIDTKHCENTGGANVTGVHEVDKSLCKQTCFRIITVNVTFPADTPDNSFRPELTVANSKNVNINISSKIEIVPKTANPTKSNKGDFQIEFIQAVDADNYTVTFKLKNTASSENQETVVCEAFVVSITPTPAPPAPPTTNTSSTANKPETTKPKKNSSGSTTSTAMTILFSLFVLLSLGSFPFLSK